MFNVQVDIMFFGMEKGCHNVAFHLPKSKSNFTFFGLLVVCSRNHRNVDNKKIEMWITATETKCAVECRQQQSLTTIKKSVCPKLKSEIFYKSYLYFLNLDYI